MSIMDFGLPDADVDGTSAIRTTHVKRPLHRLAEVRRRQGVSRRTLARRLNVDVTEIKIEERAQSDILLSRLYQWQEVLEVPVDELLVETESPLSAPVLRRAQMIRLMKTAAAILQRSQQLGIRRMAQVLVDQLVEIMPELSQVTPWHAVGKRRTKDEIGQAAGRCVSGVSYRDDVPE